MILVSIISKRYQYNNPISVIYDPDDGFIERQMEDNEVVRRYVEMDDETRYIEENKLFNLNNVEICGCSQHTDGKIASGQKPYEHIR